MTFKGPLENRPDVVDCWLEHWTLDGGNSVSAHLRPPAKANGLGVVHIRITDGVAEIVGQEKP